MQYAWIDDKSRPEFAKTKHRKSIRRRHYVETYQLPEWQRTPLQLNDKVQQYRAQAQYTELITIRIGNKITNPGYVAGQTGPMTGVTFCEGDCVVDGSRRGHSCRDRKLRSLGGFGFRGLILVTGPGGWERAGGRLRKHYWKCRDLPTPTRI
jgi:hypothetical protein